LGIGIGIDIDIDIDIDIIIILEGSILAIRELRWMTGLDHLGRKKLPSHTIPYPKLILIKNYTNYLYQSISFLEEFAAPSLDCHSIVVPKAIQWLCALQLGTLQSTGVEAERSQDGGRDLTR
jgi:hypothetical protein